MDVHRVTVFLLLFGTCLGLESSQSALSNSTLPNVHLHQGSQLDIFANLLAHKYSSDDILKLSELSSLWANLIRNQKNTSTGRISGDETLLNLCNKNLNHSPICKLINQV